MCRFSQRAAPRQRPEQAVQPKEEPVSFTGLDQRLGSLDEFEKDELDFQSLFDDDTEQGEQELDLMALFADDAPSAADVSQSQVQQAAFMQHPAAAAAVMAAPAATGIPAALAPVPAGAETVQQLQMAALMQQQMAAAQAQQQRQQHMAAAAASAAVGAPVTDLAHLQQYQAAQMQAMLAAQAASLRSGQPASKRGKSQAEIEEQQERIKKRRRESAQRSRARKNSYMKTLEVENKALKMENERLRMELMKLTQKTGSTSSSKPDTPSQHMMLSDNHSGDFSVSEGETCGNEGSGMSLPAVGANFFQLVM